VARAALADFRSAYPQQETTPLVRFDPKDQKAPFKLDRAGSLVGPTRRPPPPPPPMWHMGGGGIWEALTFLHFPPPSAPPPPPWRAPPAPKNAPWSAPSAREEHVPPSPEVNWVHRWGMQGGCDPHC